MPKLERAEANATCPPSPRQTSERHEGGPLVTQEVGHEDTTPAAALEPPAAGGEPWNGAQTEPRDAATQPEDAAPASTEEGLAASAEKGGRQPEATAFPAEKPTEPVLSSTYDPARAKRAGWWSKARSAMSGKE